MENRLKVNIFMPFYLWNNDIDRVSLTHKILIHYNNIKEKFKNQIYFKYYFVGSENELSKSIIDKYFKDSYYEFEQPNMLGSTIRKKNLILGEKVRFGVNLAIRSDYDVLLVAGSNDFVSDYFFLNLKIYISSMLNAPRARAPSIAHSRNLKRPRKPRSMAAARSTSR